MAENTINLKSFFEDKKKVIHFRKKRNQKNKMVSFGIEIEIIERSLKIYESLDDFLIEKSPPYGAYLEIKKVFFFSDYLRGANLELFFFFTEEVLIGFKFPGISLFTEGEKTSFGGNFPFQVLFNVKGLRANEQVEVFSFPRTKEIAIQTDTEFIDETVHSQLKQELADLQLELKGEKQMSEVLKTTYSQKVANLQNLLKQSEIEIEKIKKEKETKLKKKTTPLLRSLYFGEKENPILIEKNWKAWLGDPAKLEADLKIWTKNNLEIQKENKELKKTIAKLEGEKSSLKLTFEGKEKEREKEKQDLVHTNTAKDSAISQSAKTTNETLDFTNRLLVYLGKNRTTLKPAISDLNSIKFWLRKEDKPMEELVDKDYYTLPELIQETKKKKEVIDLSLLKSQLEKADVLIKELQTAKANLILRNYRLIEEANKKKKGWFW